jgi:hypothetical protein
VRKQALAASLLLVLLGVTKASEAQAHFRAGIGTGLPYGSPFPGAGLELELGHHLGLLGGMGFVGAEKPFAYGVRAYLPPRDRKWRIHASLLGWTEGYGAYLGVDHDFGKRGGFVATYGIGFGDVNQEGRVHVMIGLGRRF